MYVTMFFLLFWYFKIPANFFLREFPLATPHSAFAGVHGGGPRFYLQCWAEIERLWSKSFLSWWLCSCGWWEQAPAGAFSSASIGVTRLLASSASRMKYTRPGGTQGTHPHLFPWLSCSLMVCSTFIFILYIVSGRRGCFVMLGRNKNNFTVLEVKKAWILKLIICFSHWRK